jgi:NAD(P)-dependent dehydrogenase (short-subunit alcohol dehydrogenase family)
MKLAGKKALITGGNSGIGLATARLFISEGAEVAISGRDQRTLDEAVAELGSKAHGYRADVTVAEDRKRLFAELAKDFGKLDIVFANAGISGRTPTGATDEAIFEKIVHTNSTALSLPSIQPLLSLTTTAASSSADRCTIISVNQARLPTLRRKADSPRWRDRSPQTSHRARFA